MARFRIGLRVAASLLGAGAIWAAGECPAVEGSAPSPVHFDIEAGEALPRLNQFAQQSGLQLVFFSEPMVGLRVSGVHGDMLPRVALDTMLANTPVRYEFLTVKTVTLKLSEVVGESTVPRSAAGYKRRAFQSDRRNHEVDLEEVTIVSAAPEGSLAQTGSPSIQLNRADIEAKGFATVPGVIRTLPQVFGGGPTEDTRQIGTEAGSNLARGTGVNLRGLAAGSSLVLLNGMRGSGSGSNGTFVDVSNIPLAAVERIDILPDSSSTLYGADAVGGVVNFVMREGFDGAQTSAHYGITTSGRMEEEYVSQLVGSRSDRNSLLLALDFYSRDNLLASSRAQASSDLRPFGGSDFNVVQSNPGNIVIGASSWAIPRGQDGSSLAPSDLERNTVNLADRYAAADLLPTQQRWSLYSSDRVTFSGFSLFADALITHRDVRAASSGYPGTFSVPPTNPFYVNPIGGSGPISVVYNFLNDLGPMISDGRVRSRMVQAGVETTWSRGWSLTGSVGFSDEGVRSTISNQVSHEALYRALTSPDRVTAFNPFGDGSFTAPQVLESLRASSTVNAYSTVSLARVVMQGTIATLPGGDVVVATGSEARRQTFSSATHSTEAALPVVNSFLRPRKILSQFAEVRLPLIGEENRSPGVESLTISLAGRFERFDDIGNTLVARHGLAWKPAKGLSIRGSYSESFRPPGLVDRDESSNAEGIFSFREPQNGSVSQVLVWAGHNRDLREESAKTWTLGLELTDPDATGAAVSMTYFSTRFFDRLSQPQLSSDLLTNPAWNHLILRSWTPEYRADVCQRSPQSASAGDCLTTPVAAIADIRTRNDAIVVTRGVDLMGRRDWHTSRGAVSFVLNASYIFEFSEAETAGASLENRVSTPHYPIDLRGRGSIEWERGEFQGSADLNFQNGYRDTLSLPQRTVSPWKTLDLNFSYRAASGSLQGSTLSLHVQNAFNKMAPFVNNPVGIGYDQENGDLTGRTVSISVQKNW